MVHTELQSMPKEVAGKSKSFYGIWEGRVHDSPDCDQADEEIANLILEHIDE